MAAVVGLGVIGSTGVALRNPERCYTASANRRVGHSRSAFVSPARQWSKAKQQRLVVRMSVDVGDSVTDDPTSADGLIKEPVEELQRERDPRRGLEERYAVIDTGRYSCRSCGYIYDSEKGDTEYPIAGGIPFSQLPKDWRCPTCGAAQSYFQSKGVEVAGFAENQAYGLGGNSLTEGQKSLLIYGSLSFFFFLFLAGYWLQ